ncbi:MAG: dihydrodipicolinate synthase family protein [Candidatus Dadabacteria bacterium]
MKKDKQIIVPAITPLTSDFKLDEGALEKIFESFLGHRVMPFILGTTGEAASVPLHMKKQYVKTAVRHRNPGIFLYAGIASNCLEDSIDFGKYCFDNGVDVVAAHLPSYYSLSNKEIRNYFEQLADYLPGPLIIYNIPGTTHMSIPLEIIEQLSYHPNIIGTKDSERSDERLNTSMHLWKKRDDFVHYLGWAARSAYALINGSDGLIPSTGNLSPGIYRQMVDAVEKSDKDLAFIYQQQSDKLGEIYQKGRLLGESLWALKLLMHHEGLCEHFVMPPLQPLSQADELKLIADYESFKKQNILKV